MSDCCSSASSLDVAPNKHCCPANGKSYTKVPSQTIYHHLKEPWKYKENKQAYYFCDDPSCDVVYFGEDDSLINKAQVRTTVGVKESDNKSLLVCYCFGVTFEEAERNNAAKAFVLKKTKEQICACDTRNPSGRCCLKDFPKRG